MAKFKWKIYTNILLLCVASRLFLIFIGFIGMNLFSHYTTVPQYYPAAPGSHTQILTLPTLSHAEYFTKNLLSRFDAKFYLHIAQYGYSHESIYSKHRPANWVFFPLYPLAISIVHHITPMFSYEACGIVVSNIFLVIGLIFLYELACIVGLKKKEVWRVLFLVLIYPSSLFFSIPYTESLFFMLSTMTVYFTLKDKYFAAYLAAGLSAATRFPGFINIGFVTAILAYNAIFVNKRIAFKHILYFIVSLLPIVSFLGYMKVLTGDFLAPIHEEANWLRNTSFPFESYFRYFKHPYFIAPGGWDNGVISFTITTVVLGTYVWVLIRNKQILQNRHDWILFCYGAFLVVFPFSTSGTYLTSMVRYCMVSFPLYLYLANAMKRNKMIFQVLVMLLLGIQTIMTIGYCNDYFFVV